MSTAAEPIPASASGQDVSPPPAGWLVVARKEFADHLRSARFTIVLVLLGLSGIAAVYTAAGGIREVATEATGDPNLFLRLYTISPERIPEFFTFISLIGPLLGVAFGFDAVNGEEAQGTLPRLVSQPIYRDDVINGKFVAGLAVIALVLTSLLVLVAGIGIVRLGVVPSVEEVLRLLLYLAVSAVYVGFWLAVATLCSVAFRRAATSAMVVLGAWLVLTLFAGLVVGIVADSLAPVPAEPTVQQQVDNLRLQQSLARLSPGTLYEEATTALLTPETRTLSQVLLPTQVFRAIQGELPLTQSLLLVWPQIVGLVALVVVAFAVAYVLFMRREIRA